VQQEIVTEASPAAPHEAASGPHSEPLTRLQLNSLGVKLYLPFCLLDGLPLCSFDTKEECKMQFHSYSGTLMCTISIYLY
jgi:hypothetical protein